MIATHPMKRFFLRVDTDHETGAYKGCNLTVTDILSGEIETRYETGNFVQDWYLLSKDVISGFDPETDLIVRSSSVDHYLMDTDYQVRYYEPVSNTLVPNYRDGAWQLFVEPHRDKVIAFAWYKHVICRQQPNLN